MSARPDPGDVVRINGDLYEAVGIAEGVTVHFRKVNAPACDRCGRLPERSYVVGSLMYQTEVKPVSTVTP